MRLTEARPGARVLAFGGYQPARVVTNDELAATVDTNDEWIRSRVGIASSAGSPGRTRAVADMAAAAGGKALAGQRPVRRRHRPGDRGHLHRRDADPQRRRHGGAPARHRRARRLRPQRGLRRVLLRAGDAPATPIRAGTARHVLVIGAEKLSQWVDWTDRSTCIIFADGAGAAVVGPVATAGRARHRPGGLGQRRRPWPTRSRSRTATRSSRRRARRCSAGPPPRCTRSRRRRASWPASTPTELAAFVPHQANLRIIEAIARKLGAPPGAVVANDIVHAGNTSSASIPLALSRMIERGEVGSGDAVLLLGFGAGITYAAQVITVP